MSQQSGFDRLHPDLCYHIVNSLGWNSLRPVQHQSIAPILAGEDTVILAPTAGGKTEASFFPLISRVLSEGWEGLSIIYLSPIKALLNNQHQRLERLFGMVGHRASVWHGDVPQSEKKRIRQNPPTVLLTTPESLEAMLISIRTPSESMFGNLRVVVIDEVHAFAGDDRGWHLLGVLERLSAWAGRELQRIGLSATVGNRAEIVDWIAAGNTSTRATVDPGGATATPEVSLDYVGSLTNAAKVISMLHKGERRLVFCDSRLQAEKLTRALRSRQVETHIIHGSLSADERRRTERSFIEGGAGVIVATSALELGIDIGDLDRVLNIDAPGTVASFLQRMGRTGRRDGTTPNMLFLATEDKGLVKAAALLELWKRGHVEPAIAPMKPFHILAQQIMALVLERPGIPLSELKQRISPFMSASGISGTEGEALLLHLFTWGYLFVDGVRVGIGITGEKELGHKHYLELVSVFTTPPLFTVMHNRREIGMVHQSTFGGSVGKDKKSGPVVILLAGRSWRLVSMAWSRQIAYVEPFEMKGDTSWPGGGQPMTAELAVAHRLVLTNQCIATEHWSKRATNQLEEIQQEFTFLDPGAATLIETGNQVEYWNFAGTHANTLLSARLEVLYGATQSVGPLQIRFPRLHTMEQISDMIADANTSTLIPRPSPDHPASKHLKFKDLLPSDLLALAVAARIYQARACEASEHFLLDLSDAH